MADFEQVQNCGSIPISLRRGKEGAEEANGDMLEAIINLEKRGRIKAPETGGCYNSQHERSQWRQLQEELLGEKTAHTNGFVLYTM